MQRIYDHKAFGDFLRRANEREKPSENEAGFPEGRVWDVSAKCTSPVYREMLGAVSTMIGKLTLTDDTKRPRGGRTRLHLFVPCRKCPTCLRRRSYMWAAKAMRELEASPRTWFVTMTLRAEAQQWALQSARRHLDRQGVDYDTLNEDERFKERVRMISPSITRYLKRVREQSQAPLRYLLVAEAHKTGDPHFHALVHETRADRSIPYRVIRDQWDLGFGHAKVVDDNKRAAFYTAKYLSKSALARVRASVRYGSPEPFYDLGHSETNVERVKNVCPPDEEQIFRRPAEIPAPPSDSERGNIGQELFIERINHDLSDFVAD